MSWFDKRRFQILKRLVPLFGGDLGKGFCMYANDIIQSCNRSAAEKNYPFFSEISNQVKKSDTVFILGSGSSVSSISKKEWEVIAKHDSFGFNFFIAHSFEPSLYFFETGWNEKSTDLFFEWRIDKSQEHIPLVLNGNLIADRVWYELPDFTNCYVHYPFSLRSGSAAFVRRVLSKPWLRPMETVDRSVHHGASVSFLLDIARLMGYKNIVLVGVDLEGPYFQSNYQDNFSVRLSSLNSAIREQGRHATSSVSRESQYLPIQDFIALMQETVLVDSNSSLFQLRKSPLLPSVPLYKI